MLPKLYPNQKAIRVIKSTSDATHPYAIFNNSALEGALKNLKPNAFKLWAILNANQNNYELGFSPAHFAAMTNAHTDTARAAFKELIEKGYLVEVELRENLSGYLFIEQGDCGEKEQS